jgi:hexosaminidase
MYRRLRHVSEQLDFTGITHRSNYQPMLERLAGFGDVAPLRVLADVVEPIKRLQRTHTRHYTSETPLNRLPDAARPESETARLFTLMVDHVLSGTATPEEREAVRLWLTIWRDNDRKLQPTLQNSFLLQEDTPVSQNLSRVAAIGLQALDYLEGQVAAPPSWRSDQQAVLQQAAQPQAELLLMVVAPVQKLANAVK